MQMLFQIVATDGCGRPALAKGKRPSVDSGKEDDH